MDATQGIRKYTYIIKVESLELLTLSLNQNNMFNLYIHVYICIFTYIIKSQQTYMSSTTCNINLHSNGPLNISK